MKPRSVQEIIDTTRFFHRNISFDHSTLTNSQLGYVGIAAPRFWIGEPEVLFCRTITAPQAEELGWSQKAIDNVLRIKGPWPSKAKAYQLLRYKISHLEYVRFDAAGLDFYKAHRQARSAYDALYRAATRRPVPA